MGKRGGERVKGMSEGVQVGWRLPETGKGEANRCPLTVKTASRLSLTH